MQFAAPRFPPPLRVQNWPPPLPTSHRRCPPQAARATHCPLAATTTSAFPLHFPAEAIAASAFAIRFSAESDATLTGLPSGQTLRVRVIALNSAGPSAASEVAEIKMA